VEDIKEELETRDEEVENAGDLREVPMVTVKAEALEDMKIENGEKDKEMENPVEKSDDTPDPMVDTPTESNSQTKAVHKKEKPHQCEHRTCGKKFASKRELLAHYRSKHGLAKLKCQEGNCEEEFTQQSTLDRHIKEVHRREKRVQKPHQCKHQTCGAQFARKDHLLGHYRSKHGLAKLKCQEGNCEKEFTAHKSLSYHIKRVHRCGVPGCAFRSSGEALADHGRAHHGHSRLPCPVDTCTESFIFKVVQHAHVKKEHGRG